MLTVVFAVTTCVCGCGWFHNHVALRAMKRFCKLKNMLPTDEEAEACYKWEFDKVLRIR